MLNHFGENTMKRLSLEELKAMAGKNVITQLEYINGGDEGDDELDRVPKPPEKPRYPCTERA
jgi:hypothetical protein